MGEQPGAESPIGQEATRSTSESLGALQDCLLTEAQGRLQGTAQMPQDNNRDTQERETPTPRTTTMACVWNWCGMILCDMCCVAPWRKTPRS